MQILIDRQNCGKYISFEEIADILQEQYHLEIDDVHNQVYKPIHVLQAKVMKKLPQLAQRNGFIEICKSFCRLNSSIWVMD
jgi:hypothetical protein